MEKELHEKVNIVRRIYRILLLTISGSHGTRGNVLRSAKDGREHVNEWNGWTGNWGMNVMSLLSERR